MLLSTLRRLHAQLAQSPPSASWVAPEGGSLRVPRLVEIRLRPAESRGPPRCDPAGVAVMPGETLRWLALADGLCVACYHPMNGRGLRIPAGAAPWNSRPLARGQSFCLTLSQEGVYDYFCTPGEALGMVGRIVVGRGGAVPSFDRSVPPAARAAFPSVEKILRRGLVGG